MSSIIASLEQVLTYENNAVVTRFCADSGLTEMEAREIWLETKRWLWLCARHAEDGLPGSELTMSSEMSVIDEMWHTFLLFTKDYADFCERYFKMFVHHQPTPVSEKLKMTPEMRLETLKTNYEYIYDHLGADVLKRWCEEFPERFNSKF